MKSIENEIHENRQKAASLLDNYRKQIDSISNDPMRSALAKNTEMAQLFKDGTATLKRLRENEMAIVSNRIISNSRDLFGYSNQGDLDARRSADDRADALDNEQQALQAHIRATQNADSVLQKSIARKAYESGWKQVLSRHVEDRPEDQEKINELSALVAFESNPANVVLASTHYLMVKPAQVIN